MSDYHIVCSVNPYDGREGFFWRRGERWLKERGVEYRLLDIAPTLEIEWMEKHMGVTDTLACNRSEI